MKLCFMTFAIPREVIKVFALASAFHFKVMCPVCHLICGIFMKILLFYLDEGKARRVVESLQGW